MAARVQYVEPVTLLDANGVARPVHSLLRVPGRLHYGEFVWDDRGVPAGKLWVRVDPKTQTLSVFRAGHEIGTAVILFGTDDKPTPRGTFKVLQKSKDYFSRTYNAPMPYALRLTDDGVALHSSDVRFGAATHGCIGLPKAFATKLFNQASLGDEVSII